MWNKNYNYELEVKKLLSNYKEEEVNFFKGIVDEVGLSQATPMEETNFISTEEGSYGK